MFNFGEWLLGYRGGEGGLCTDLRVRRSHRVAASPNCAGIRRTREPRLPLSRIHFGSPNGAELLPRRSARQGAQIRHLRLVSLATAILMGPPIANAWANSEYRISAGDVLELSVVGVPELQHKATVTPDGTVSFPSVDDIRADGRALSEVREELRAQLSRKVVPRTKGNGIDDTVAFSAGQISLAVAEYRPIYVTGQVARSGEQRFRIGMTAREAIAVAGGYSLLPASEGSGQGMGVQAEYGVLLNELAREQTLLLRLQAEYDGASSFEAALERGGEGLAALQGASEMVQLEAEQFESREAAHAKEKAHLNESIETVRKHLALLTERRSKEAAALEADQADFDRINGLFKSGVTVAVRVTEARRSVLFSATQLLQTDASIASATREMMALKRDAARLDEKKRQSLIEGIQGAKAKVQNLQTKLMFLAQQVAVIPHLSSQEEDSTAVTVTIFRRQAGVSQRIVANRDTELSPGDVVEISLPGAIVANPIALGRR